MNTNNNLFSLVAVVAAGAAAYHQPSHVYTRSRAQIKTGGNKNVAACEYIARAASPHAKLYFFSVIKPRVQFKSTLLLAIARNAEREKYALASPQPYKI